MKISDLPKTTISHLAFLRTPKTNVIGKVNGLWTLLLPIWHTVATRMHNLGLPERSNFEPIE